jgi:hypothetical protein
MNEREYLRLKRHIEDEYRQKLAALELVWRMSGKTTGRAVRLPRAAVQQLVRAFLDQSRQDEFSSEDILNYVRQTTPDIVVGRSSISRVLQRLVSSSELELIARGKGNKPGRYRRGKGAPVAA